MKIVEAGPPEISELGRDVDTMRARIASELARVERARAALMERSAEQARSNADLEQFAYVASHDLSEPLRKVANFCQLLERQYAAQLDDKAELYISFAVDADPTLLVALFQNLIGNAVKYRSAERPQRIEITAERRGAEWMFTIADNGIGIDPRYSDRIFTIFQPLHLREEYGGTGIGLVRCRKIVEFHRGQIWLGEK